ncbi:MAG: MFS transporter [Chloroflexi bacterium]|nr:MFS transporter [Chloroflexota bacterium]
MSLFRSLTHRSFAFLWSGQTISRLGDSLYRIALAWWVLEKTGSAAIMGTVLIFSFLPMLVFLLIGGVAVDRLPRGRVMLASDLLRGTLVASIAVLAFTQALDIWHVYIASMVFGFVDAFFQPAYTAIVPEIVPSEMLPSANSLTNLSGKITGIVGPALGASIVALGGTPIAFALDAASFFISAICLVPIIGLIVRPAEKSASVIGDLRDGLSTVLGTPWLWLTIAIFALANITMDGPIAVSLPFLVKDSLNADVSALGWLYSMSSLGAIVGAIWLGRFPRIRRRGILTYGAGIVSALMVVVAGLPISLSGVLIVMFIEGACVATFGLIWTNTLQEMVPRERLGRVSSIDMLGSYVLLPIGYGMTGWVTDLIGAPLVFIFGGAIGAMMIALGLLHPAIRGLD